MVVHPIGDGYVALQTAGATHLWARLVALVGRPELASDARFATPIARRANWADLLGILRQWLDGFESVDQAVAVLSAARVPCVPMLSPEALIDHPHMAARSAFPEVAHPARGNVRVTATPFHVDGQPIEPAGPAPYLVGEHTGEVLMELLGYPEERVRELAQAGAVADGQQ
jgi:crotonobetainyl-CoA:carnitine CoA-transferase CaiB-like acyl-CoA transferase